MPAKTNDENPNAFKLWINREVLKTIARAIADVHPDFAQKKFIALAPELDPLELKGRVVLVREHLRSLLPSDYPKALTILLKSARGGALKGFALWPYTDFIQTYGFNHVALSLRALRELTPLFTAEFAVRPFLIDHQSETLRFLLDCAGDSDVHVRRWASEGSRPRLPWGERLGAFIKDPTPALPILEQLRFDPELYVRKSVANHLNDISKDHPKVALELLARWNKETPPEHQTNMTWITRHALRTLIKRGDKQALRMLGSPVKTSVKVRGLKLARKAYKLGEHVEFSFAVESLGRGEQKLIIDYVVHFVKANKKTSPRVFKLKTVPLAKAAQLRIEKRHWLKRSPYRKHYPGRHRLEIQINGSVCASTHFTLR